MPIMYHQYFGLKEAPFSIAVNPRYLFMSPRHRDALAHLLYGVGAGGGFILLTGEVGTGKTTINRCLLEQLPDDTDIAIIFNPALNALELLASVCDELGIDYGRDQSSLKSLTDHLHRFLLENHARGRKTVLLIDEAQHLDFDVLEQIRLLTNLETHSQKLLQIILIGQPELAGMLHRPELRQLNQRITARYNLQALNLAETRAYIRHRLQVAGLTADRELFSPAALRYIHRQSRGIPRLINVLCDRSLLGAYGRNQPRVDRRIAAAAAREVLGEYGGVRRLPRSRVLPGLLLALLLAGGLALWWYTQQPAVPAPASSAAGAAGQSPLPATADLVNARDRASTDRPGGALAADDRAVGGKGEWMLAPESASASLWRLYSADPLPAQPCADAWPNGLACLRDHASSWQVLRGFDRPLLLELLTPEGFGAAALLLGLDAGSAHLLTRGGGLVQLPLAELGALWTGEFYLYWRPPASFERTVSRGDRSPLVAVVARQLAALDGQAQALAGEQFNAALEARVKLFQQRHALEADGVVGARTLLRLQEVLDPSLTRSGTRQRLGGREPSP